MQYNPSFIMYRPILSEEDKQWLHALAAKYSLHRFKEDARNYEEMTVDFVYTSAKIEGNTYDRIDTDNLLRMGVTAGGKRYSDAVMLVNLRDGFGKVMNIEANTALDLDYLCDLHKLLMKDLLPIHEQGIARTSGVHAARYPDPFEQAIYLHCNLAYLQYFRDGNKRTSRLMQTAVLVRGGMLPLFFKDTLIDQYQRATLHYYETGEYGPYVSFFKENYQIVINALVGDGHTFSSAEEIAESEQRIAQLPKLKNGSGAAHLFWLLAQQAIESNGSAKGINWAEIERRAIVECIAGHGHSPEGVGAVLCKHSPGATSAEKQSAILEDIARLAPDLRLQYERSKKIRNHE